MRALSAILCVALSATAFADAASDAKAFYERATADFAVGDFAKAADEYQQAYRLKPDAALLYNAAQSYRLAGNNEKALILYKNYVMFYPNQPNVDQVRSQIDKLKEAVAIARAGEEQSTDEYGAGAADAGDAVRRRAAATTASAAAVPDAADGDGGQAASAHQEAVVLGDARGRRARCRRRHRRHRPRCAAARADCDRWSRGR